MDSKKLALLCRKLADARKAEEIVLLDMRSLTTVTDFFVICTGTSEPHLRAIRDEITEKLRSEHGRRPRAVDGVLETGWVVLDYSDVMVHIMRAEQRQRYDLEGLWSDAPVVAVRAEAGPRARIGGRSGGPRRRARSGSVGAAGAGSGVESG